MSLVSGGWVGGCAHHYVFVVAHGVAGVRCGILVVVGGYTHHVFVIAHHVGVRSGSLVWIGGRAHHHVFVVAAHGAGVSGILGDCFFLAFFSA